MGEREWPTERPSGSIPQPGYAPPLSIFNDRSRWQPLPAYDQPNMTPIGQPPGVGPLGTPLFPPAPNAPAMPGDGGMPGAMPYSGGVGRKASTTIAAAAEAEQ